MRTQMPSIEEQQKQISKQYTALCLTIDQFRLDFDQHVKATETIIALHQEMRKLTYEQNRIRRSQTN